jgi:DUF4097 and DUF4098 domain-containing protein YvlB
MTDNSAWKEFIAVQKPAVPVEVSRKPPRASWLSALWLLLPLGLVAAAGPLRLEKTFLTTPNPRITVNNLRGQVVVRGWEKAQVRATSTAASSRVEIDMEAMPDSGPAERIHFRTHVLDPMLSEEEEAADYTLDVPVGASLEIRNRQGAVQVEKIHGDAWIESAGGPIRATEVAGHLTTRTLGGDIEIIRPSGRIEASSITGHLRFRQPLSTRIRANTNSGKISYEGDFAPSGEYILSTYSGDIELFCPPEASFDLNAKTVKGKLDNTFELRPKRHVPSPALAGSSLLGTHRTGTAAVELSSFSGTIRVRARP